MDKNRRPSIAERRRRASAGGQQVEETDPAKIAQQVVKREERRRASMLRMSHGAQSGMRELLAGSLAAAMGDIDDDANAVERLTRKCQV